MLARALLIIAATVHFAEFKPKGKYYLIEAEDKGELKDEGKTGDDGETGDIRKTKDDGDMICEGPCANTNVLDVKIRKY